MKVNSHETQAEATANNIDNTMNKYEKTLKANNKSIFLE